MQKLKTYRIIASALVMKIRIWWFLNALLETFFNILSTLTHQKKIIQTLTNQWINQYMQDAQANKKSRKQGVTKN